MLITDTDWITAADLSIEDPEVGEQAAAVPNLVIDSPTPGAPSIIHNTLDEVGTDILAAFQNFSGYLLGLDTTQNHVAAVLNTLSTSISRPRMMLQQVCAFEPQPTKQGIIRYSKYRCLENVFRALFHRRIGAKDEDRFERKMNIHRAAADQAWNKMLAMGVPVVLQSLSAPGALREYNAGLWQSTNVTFGGSGSTEAGHTYDVTITYVSQGLTNGSPGNYMNFANKNNSESGYPTAVQCSPTAGTVMTFSIANLNPPNGTIPAAVGTADGIYTPLKATGWNVYAGIHSSPFNRNAMFLQNTSAPIAIEVTSYTLPNAPTLSGPVLQSGQSSDYNFAFQRTLGRA